MITTIIHRVTNVEVKNDYLPETETHYTTITVDTESGEQASFTLFANDDAIKMKTTNPINTGE